MVESRERHENTTTHNFEGRGEGGLRFFIVDRRKAPVGQHFTLGDCLQRRGGRGDCKRVAARTATPPADPPENPYFKQLNKALALVV